MNLFKHGMSFDEPNVWDVCGEVFHMEDFWETDWDEQDRWQRLVCGGWWLEVEPWLIGDGAVLLWGTEHDYGEPMGLLGGQTEYIRQQKKED